MILPRAELARRVDGALEEVEAARAIEVVAHVVFTRPAELHRHADLLGDDRRFGQVVVGEPAAEAAAHADHVQGDGAGLEADGAAGGRRAA